MKYHSPNTDLAALQRELAGSGKSSDDTFDEHDEYVDDEADDSDFEEADDRPGTGQWGARRR